VYKALNLLYRYDICECIEDIYTRLQKRCSIHLSYTNIQISNEMQNVRHAKIQLFKHKIVLKIIVLTLLDLILI